MARRFKNNNFSASLAGFTLIEILIVIAVALILLSIGVSILGSKTPQKSLDAKAREVVELISEARGYAASGYFGSAWGVQVLNDNGYCQDSGDCIVVFKGTAYSTRDMGYDRVVNINNGVYLESSQIQSFYFNPISGWSSSDDDKTIILKNNIGEQLTVTVTAVGLVYYGT
ncbi:MAG: prepilin-type N-terminal cleavage/methylation domain-containing protein [Patescibacteria group bacterium]